MRIEAKRRIQAALLKIAGDELTYEKEKDRFIVEVRAVKDFSRKEIEEEVIDRGRIKLRGRKIIVTWYFPNGKNSYREITFTYRNQSDGSRDLNITDSGVGSASTAVITPDVVIKDLTKLLEDPAKASELVEFVLE